MSPQSEDPHNVPVPVYIPGELIADVLSFLPVKSILRLRCVSKTLNSLISDPFFVKLHLNRSKRKDELKLVQFLEWDKVSFTVFRMSENPPLIFNLPEDSYHTLKDNVWFNIVGSCNGLICFYDQCYNYNSVLEMWLRIWNPATRTISEKIWCSGIGPIESLANFMFGCDNSTNTYKVLYFIPFKKQVKVLTLGNKVRRNIQKSPVKHCSSMNLAHLSGTVNWLAIRKHYSTYDYKNITIEQFVIISLDLGTETHTQLRPPPGFYEVPFVEPNLSVLMDFLCFSHYFKQTHLVIWQMKEFGVEESWSQFLKISYDTLLLDYHFSYFKLLLLCYSEKNDTLFFMNYLESQAVICNRRFNRVEKMNRVEGIDRSLLLSGHDHVESLVWYC
ncbi:F-box/kelch-repeat protein At3g23880-like [Vicia villosa]|uniref:F-box/kelch-repeat protein At3g23880-like n=1 Tax=Vicia villosa TaxID=3911 RepID=UPI00273BE135|nr:F-box/kelch-repeat protein At3g23880-like [Vicia villosa]XP_058767691.1 F-box/kelch-repeat protein At3g23880-like [Vicia villosa]